MLHGSCGDCSIQEGIQLLDVDGTMECLAVALSCWVSYRSFTWLRCLRGSLASTSFSFINIIISYWVGSMSRAEQSRGEQSSHPIAVIELFVCSHVRNSYWTMCSLGGVSCKCDDAVRGRARCHYVQSYMLYSFHYYFWMLWAISVLCAHAANTIAWMAICIHIWYAPCVA